MAARGWTEVRYVSQVSPSSGDAWGKQSSLDLKSRLVWGSGRSQELQGTALKQRGEEQGRFKRESERMKEWEFKGGRKTVPHYRKKTKQNKTNLVIILFGIASTYVLPLLLRNYRHCKKQYQFACECIVWHPWPLAKTYPCKIVSCLYDTINFAQLYLSTFYTH